MRAYRRLVLLAAMLCGSGILAERASAQMTDPDQERARQLVLRIRRSMREIDTLLLTGSQPAKVEKELAANIKRIEELLKETESKSESVMKNIDELIKLTKYQKSKDKSSSSGGGDGESDPKQGKQPTREKSQDPQELQPQPQPGQQPPDSKDDQQDGKDPKDQKKPTDGKADPKSGRPDHSPPKQEDADRPPPKGATGEFERADTSGRWGMLPPKVAEDLQRRNAEEFPQRYRLWMELYFRRMNKLPARDR